MKKLIWKREDFLEAGGSDFKYIPCLNFTENAIKLIHSLVLDDIEGWGNNDLGHEKREGTTVTEKKALFLVRKIILLLIFYLKTQPLQI